MKHVPLTRFRRELRKWVRSGETIYITRCGVPVAVFMPKSTYEELTNEE